jgi:hypothetical protein
MIRKRQNIVNNREVPIYVSIEPAPECYELEPGETLTLIYEWADHEALPELNVIDEGIVVLPLEAQPEVLINGLPAEGRSWKFKHIR